MKHLNHSSRSPKNIFFIPLLVASLLILGVLAYAAFTGTDFRSRAAGNRRRINPIKVSKPTPKPLRQITVVPTPTPKPLRQITVVPTPTAKPLIQITATPQQIYVEGPPPTLTVMEAMMCDIFGISCRTTN
jgi:hypothetical protein